jgi:hemolysin III
VHVKPVLRGVFHEAGFILVVALSVPLALSAEGGRALVSAIVFSACLAGCFGASALYHRPTWTPSVRAVLARVDHAGIYLLIAGTYTPFGLLVLSTGWAVPVLAIVWSGVALAILLKLLWATQPKHVSAAIGIGLGWVGVVSFSQLLKLPTVGLLLVVGGGLAYTAGAVTYALKRPNPFPRILGYHEIFHVLTLVAAGCQYAAVAFYVLPRG